MAETANSWLLMLSDKILSADAISTSQRGKWWNHKMSVAHRKLLSNAIIFAAQRQCWHVLDDYGQVKFCNGFPAHEGDHTFVGKNG